MSEMENLQRKNERLRQQISEVRQAAREIATRGVSVTRTKRESREGTPTRHEFLRDSTPGIQKQQIRKKQYKRRTKSLAPKSS